MKDTFRKKILGLAENCLISALSTISESVYLLPIDKKDFEFSKIALNINHKNPIIKYIARAAAASGDSGSTLETFIQKYPIDVLKEIEVDFEAYYINNPVEGHNLSILYEQITIRMITYMECLLEAGYGDDTEYLMRWILRNPVKLAVEDWS